MYDDDENEPGEGNFGSNPGISTEGETTVATRRGYRFVSSDEDLPEITSEGVKVTAEKAEALVAESNGLVSVVESKE